MSAALSLGEIAYESYCESRHWLAFNGTDLPDWSEQKDDLKEAWEIAAQAVAAEIKDRHKEPK